jgi:hypothetical protein
MESCWKCVVALFPESEIWSPCWWGEEEGGGGLTPYLLLLIFSSSLSSLIFPILHSNLEAKEAPKNTKPKEEKNKERERERKMEKLQSFYIMIVALGRA